ncbi:MAG: hypothetical protein AAGI30_01050 [Planctomycetota bacterium]
MAQAELMSWYARVFFAGCAAGCIASAAGAEVTVTIGAGTVFDPSAVSSGEINGQPFELGPNTRFVVRDGGVIERLNTSSFAFDMQGSTIDIDDAGLLEGVPFQLWYLQPIRVRNLTLNVLPGGTIHSRVEVPFDATVNIDGGFVFDEFTVGDNVTLNVRSGTVRNFFVAEPGSTVLIDGGTISFSPTIHSGAMLTVVSGGINQNLLVAGGTVMAQGGRLGRGLDIDAGGTVTLDGADIHEFTQVLDGGRLDWISGTIGLGLETSADGSLEVHGGEWQLDGSPIDAVPAGGLEPGSILTGTVSDGTPFILTTLAGDTVAPGTATLVSASFPPITPGPQVAGDGEWPGRGLRAGESLELPAGATATRDFAVVEASLTITGGEVSDWLETAFSTVTMTNGSIGKNAAIHDSVLDLSGGTMGAGAVLTSGTRAHVRGHGALGPNTTLTEDTQLLVTESGFVSYGLTTRGRSRLQLEGGEIDSNAQFRDESHVLVRSGTLGLSTWVRDNALLSIGGGTVEGELRARSNGHLRIAGGTFEGGIFADNGSVIELFATSASIDGTPVALVPGRPVIIGDREGADVAVTLLDGSELELDLFAVDPGRLYRLEFGQPDVIDESSTLTITGPCGEVDVEWPYAVLDAFDRAVLWASTPDAAAVQAFNEGFQLPCP